MQTVNYIGINNQVCQCEFVTGTVNGGEVLVLKQTPNSTTSITNMVESIVSALLSGPLNNMDATKLRVFEFYSPSIKPLIVWQEVVFSGVAKREPRRTILEKLVEFIRPTEQPYVVWAPQWAPVSPALATQLALIDPALV